MEILTGVAVIGLAAAILTEIIKRALTSKFLPSNYVPLLALLCGLVLTWGLREKFDGATLEQGLLAGFIAAGYYDAVVKSLINGTVKKVISLKKGSDSVMGGL